LVREGRNDWIGKDLRELQGGCQLEEDRKIPPTRETVGVVTENSKKTSISEKKKRGTKGINV